MVALNVGLRVAAFAGRDLWLAIGLLLPVAWAGVWTGNRVHMGVAHEFSVSSLLVWMSIEARRIHRMQYEYVATYRRSEERRVGNDYRVRRAKRPRAGNTQ